MTAALATVRELDFSSSAISAVTLSDVCEYNFGGPWIVVNLAGSDATVAADVPTTFAPLDSLLLSDAAVTGQLLVAFSISDPGRVVADARANWLDFYADRGAAAPYPVLLKSVQHSVGRTVLDLPSVLRQPGLGRSAFTVRLNLWYSPADTACGIHNEHDFIEVHTQLFGRGRMQKFRLKDEFTKYEEHLTSVGNTNPAHFCREHAGRFVYPWHQYYADTDCLWLAIEYHADNRPVGTSPT